MTGPRPGAPPGNRIRPVQAPDGPRSSGGETSSSVESLRQGPDLGLRRAALDLGAQGRDVLPCIPTGRKAKAPHLPARDGRGGFHDASRDPVIIASWWARWPDAMIGAVIPAGVIVLDLDPRHGGTLDTLESLLGPLPETLTVISGRGDGGRHLYFRRPAGPLRCNPAPWLDVKVNGYCIVPPSIHPDSGERYRWVTRPVVELPEAAVTALRPPTPCQPLPRSISQEGIDRRGEALTRAVATASEGRRNHLLFWACCRAITEGHGPELLDAIEAAGLTAGLDPAEVQRTMQSAQRRVTA